MPTLTHVLFSKANQAFTDRLTLDGHQMLLGLSGYPTERKGDLLQVILSRPDALYLTGINRLAQTRRQLRAAKPPIVET